MATRKREDLLERESELALASQLLEDAKQGRGALLVIEGPAGIGKTALLDQVCRFAAERDVLVLRARGGEVEREFPHGIVRQVFETELRDRSEQDRSTVLSGAAQLAGPVVAPGASVPASPPAADSSFAVTHGLYWVAANLADQRPLVIAVDDAQWSDVVSLRFLLYLALRLEGLPLLIALTARTDELEEPERLLSQLRSRADAVVLRPAPLSDGGVASVVAGILGDQPDRDFAAACRRATGGRPFLVGELARELAARRVRPTVEAVAEVVDVVPQAVTQAIVLRLASAPGPAADLARAVAVLGTEAQMHRAGQLAGTSEAQAVEAADVLAAMEILQFGLPLQFVHPIVREAVYEEMPAAARAAAHARAAEMLHEERAELDAVAAHLLLTQPEARSATVARLREAAAHAVQRGASEGAAVYLQRALAEGGLDSQLRAQLLQELGRAERQQDAPAAIQHLREAHSLSPVPAQRARVAYDLADTLFYRTAWQEVIRLVETVLDEFDDEDRELVLRLEALRLGAEFYDGRRLVDVLRRVPKLRTLARPDSPAGRLMALLLAGLTAWMGRPVAEIEEMIAIGMPDGRLLVGEDPESWVTGQIFPALVLTDDLERASSVAHELVAEAHARGSGGGVALAIAHRGWIHSRRGDLVSAEADVRTSLKLAREHHIGVGDVGIAWYFVEPLTERPELEDEMRRVLARELDAGMEQSVIAPLVLEPRGRLRLAQGDVTGAIEDLTKCSQTIYALGNPNGWAWRPALALALAGQDREQALDLARAEVEAARRVGLPRAIGVGLRTLGLVEGRDGGLDLLEEAVQVLEASPARLEHARALVEFGAARRRGGDRTAAREPLREGLDLAHRCGATRLEERAHEELKATGARPRRAMLTGRDALTATEQRIAGMAADGMSNPAIAQALFVTRKTVENRLSRIYPKLGINSRDQLQGALEP